MATTTKEREKKQGKKFEELYMALALQDRNLV